MKKKQNKIYGIEAVSDYIVIDPDPVASGNFHVSDGTAVKEMGIIVFKGPKVEGLETGQHVVFNAWACDEKEISGVRFLFTSQSANGICAILS